MMFSLEKILFCFFFSISLFFSSLLFLFCYYFNSVHFLFSFIIFVLISNPQLDNHEIKPGKSLKINISVPNLRLFVGNIPKSKGKEEILDEFGKLTGNWNIQTEKQIETTHQQNIMRYEIR